MIHSAKIWCVVPAAGIGSRMQAAIPKQYLMLHGQPVLLHTLERLCRHSAIAGVYVGIHPTDTHWRTLDVSRLTKLSGAYKGGATRAQTVLKGVHALTDRARDDDWIMVHDAVRPCVRAADIDALVAAVADKSEGGVLAIPLTDTIKRADADARIVETLPRATLWRAATPQMFRLGALRTALSEALAAGVDPTDESMAIERAGGRPRLVAGSADNIKVTTPDDLALASFFLMRSEGRA